MVTLCFIYFLLLEWFKGGLRGRGALRCRGLWGGFLLALIPRFEEDWESTSDGEGREMRVGENTQDPNTRLPHTRKVKVFRG